LNKTFKLFTADAQRGQHVRQNSTNKLLRLNENNLFPSIKKRSNFLQLMLNVDNMSGSTFLNFFLLSVIEGPGYFIGVWLSVKYFLLG
jgi:hypothetical protein